MERLLDGSNFIRKVAISNLGQLKVEEILYYLAFFLYCMGSTLLLVSFNRSGYSFMGSVCNLMKLGAFALLLIKCCLFQKCTKKQWFIITVMGVIAILSYRATHNLTIVSLCLFVVAGKDVKLKRLAFISLSVCIFVLMIAVVGSMNGFLENVYLNRDGFVGVRSSVGFKHPNSFGIVVAWICISYIAYNDMKIGFATAFLVVLSVYVILDISDSRTAAICLLIGALIFFIGGRVKSEQTKRIYAFVLLIIVLAIIASSFYLMLFYNSGNKVEYLMNKALSGRLSYMHFYFENYRPGLFGQDTSLLPLSFQDEGGTTSSFVVDNAYARLYLNFGPIVTGFYIAVLLTYFVSSLRKGRLDLAMIGLMFAAIYGFAEHDSICFEFNYFMLGFSYLLYGFPEKVNRFGDTALNLNSK